MALAGCRAAPPHGDDAFAEVQARGARVMGVNQNASTHVFDDLADGGRIRYTADDLGDTAAVRTIRAHLRDVATAFAAGDFSQPEAVHGRAVPGADVLAARRAHLGYAVADIPGGAELRITTTDPEALAGLRRFLQFQRMDHRAAGHEAHAAHDAHRAHAGPAAPASGTPPSPE